LESTVAVVTGATSGIGAATAVAYGEAGASVVVSGRRRQEAEATASTITTAGGEAEVVLGDVSESSFADHLVATAVERFGRIDIVANVAGTITRGDATDTTDDEWYQNFKVNTDAVFFLSRAAVRAFRDQGGGGVIVNLASNVGLVGSAGLPAYCASKGAVVLLTKAMALDHAAEGIRINALCPGAVDTPMLVSGQTGRSHVDVLAANVASIPQGRVPSPDEIAAAMVFLASDAAAHITGVALPIDGGYCAG
jgi:2,3-dihydro-2,3-dihydroxybenzoate dehydrogenase